MKFTDPKIRNLKPGPERYEEWEGNGLGIRVSPRGLKSWVFLYRFEGKPRRMTLGRYPEVTLAQAHQRHGAALAQLECGEDPGAARVVQNREDRAALTVNALAEEYLEKWAKPRKRSWAEDQRILNKDVLPRWGRRKAKDIARRDIILLLDEIVERGAPIGANLTLAVVRKMFNFALSRDIVQASPCVAIKAPAQATRRDRVLSEEEIRGLWAALNRAGAGEEAGTAAPSMSLPTALALKLQLVTVQRKGEVITARKGDMDLKAGWWTIPAETVKNKLPHRVPLSRLAVELFTEAVSLSGDSPWLFPSPRRGRPFTAPTEGDGVHRPITAPAVDHAVRRNLEVFGIPHWTPHDLRRTAASHMTSAGISRLTVSKILNHAEGGVTAVYDRHSYDAEKRQALELWGRRLEAIIRGEEEPGNVVALKQRR